MVRIWKSIPWLLTIITIQFIDLLGSTTGQGALYADGNGYHQYGYGLYNIRIDGRLQAALQDEREREGVRNACQDWAEFVHERTFEANLP